MERDLDWEPDIKKTPLTAPPRTSSFSSSPPPPAAPPIRNDNVAPWPFSSRRDIGLSILVGSSVVWLTNNKFGPMQFADKPDIDFSLVGYTDLRPQDFTYLKTRGGHWVAAAQDQEGRIFMVDEIGDLYYDTGDSSTGMYVMDTQGNLFNFYLDEDKQRKITPVGNVTQLKRFQMSEVANMKFDRPVNVVAFDDGSLAIEPPEGPNGEIYAPSELIDLVPSQPPRTLFEKLLGRGAPSPIERLEVDLEDPRPFDRQMWDQVFLDDPDLDGFQVALPKDLDIDKLAQEVIEEERRRKK